MDLESRNPEFKTLLYLLPNTGSVEVDGSIPSSSTTLQSDSMCLERQTELVAVGGMVVPLRIG